MKGRATRVSADGTGKLPGVFASLCAVSIQKAKTGKKNHTYFQSFG